MLDEQQDLFGPLAPKVEAAEARPDHVALAAQLPDLLAVGTMSWSFPGWAGILYRSERLSPKHLPAHGLLAYARHPLLRAVEIDQTFYRSLSAEGFQHFAAQVPDAFRFLVKAHQECTVRRFPNLSGAKAGQLNPRYLDPVYATEAVVAPALSLGAKLGAIIFQFPPQQDGDPKAFAHQLHAFLKKLPKGPTYAVELRNEMFLTPAYAAALADAGVVHCHNAHSQMPSVLEQAKQLPPATRRPLIVRWLLRPGDNYEQARDRYTPFDRLVDEDVRTRSDIANLIARALRHGVPVFASVNNKAEGCAPESIFRLLHETLERSRRRIE